MSTSGGIQVAPGTLTPPVTITNTAPGTVPLTITGANGQTADLLDIGAFGGAAGGLLKVTPTSITAGVAMVLAGATWVPALGFVVNGGAGSGTTWLTPVGVAAAVNNVQIINAATGTAPSIAATGTDAAVGLTIQTRNASAPVNALTFGSQAQPTATFQGIVNINNGNPIQVTSLQSPTDGATLLSTAGSSKLAFYGNAPVAKAAAIASPISDVSGTKAAIDALRVALQNIGITS
ncbi:MAG TPA: hypothetical protein VHQ90_00080 [Thermoanaerobaculia bacterium]|nr:hypothetical protein [Thermoanaerobaculia bacterium]